MGNELALVFFTSLVDLGTGLFIALCINEWLSVNEQVKYKGVLTVLIILVLGGFSSILHLGHPERIFGALSHPTSGIFIESSMIGLTGICVVAYLYALKRQATKQVLKAITLVGAIPAVILSFAVGDSYVMESRPAWDTLTIPFVYLGSAGLMGSLAYTALLSNPTEALVNKMKRIIQVMVLLQALAILAYLIALGSAPYPDASRSVAKVLSGGLASLFWCGIVIVGLIIPMGLASFKNKASGIVVAISSTPFILGVICAFVGATVYRVIMFNLGTTIWQFF
jgi:anaerobic dimethyl sulfoxide reductase subunit C (anchor subunit)